ncbi:MAG: hypothetical protein V7K15_09500 [Nostoc sp.]
MTCVYRQLKLLPNIQDKVESIVNNSVAANIFNNRYVDSVLSWFKLPAFLEVHNIMTTSINREVSESEKTIFITLNSIFKQIRFYFYSID